MLSTNMVPNLAYHLWMNPDDDLVTRLRACPINEVCHYLAMRVRRYRQDQQLSQADFAREAGIPLRTYKRFESHGKATLETFVEVLRAMDRTQYVFTLFPSPAPRPSISLEDRLRSLKIRGQGAPDR